MNSIKTVLFLGVLTALILAGGYYFGGQQGALLALGISAVMNIGSYWFSDKIVLAMYKAKPASKSEYPQLHKMVHDLAMRAQIPVPRLYIVDMPVPNAFATGRNPQHAVVAVTTGIVQLLDERELRGVLAHEISHITNNDILISSIAATLAGALSYLAQFAYYSGGRDDDNRSHPFGILLFLILTPIIATLLHLAISRSREYMADHTGSELSHDPLALASALEKMHAISKKRPLVGEPKYEATAHLFIINPFRGSWLTSLFSTHPPVEERVRRLHNFQRLTS